MAQNYFYPPGGSATISGTIDTNLKQVGGVGITLGQKAAAASLPVVLASDQGALPLSTGAATSALQTTGNTALSTINTTLGTPMQQTGGSVTANAGTNLNTSALALESGGNLASINTKTPALGQALAASSVPVVLTAAQVTTLTPPTSVTVTQATGTNLHAVIDAGSAVIGKVGIDQTTPGTTNGVQVVAALPAGTALMGKVGLDQTTPGTTNAVSLAQLGATTVATGNGVVSAGVQRVAIASDNTAFGVNATTAGSAGPANAPVVTTYGTPITSAAYTTIIASTTSATNVVEVFDSSGVALYFAVGAAASEVNQFIIYPGGNGQVSLQIPAGSRISYKAVSTSASGASAYNILNLYK